MAHQKLKAPACPRWASGHAWRVARERSTPDCEADVCEAWGLVRMTSYRTGRVVSGAAAGVGAAATPGTQGGDEIPRAERQTSGVHELPSVSETRIDPTGRAKSCKHVNTGILDTSRGDTRSHRRLDSEPQTGGRGYLQHSCRQSGLFSH